MNATPFRVEADVVEPGVVLGSDAGEEHGAVEVVDETGAILMLHAAGPEGELLQHLDRGSSLVVTAVALGHSGGRSHLLVHSIDALAAETPPQHRGGHDDIAAAREVLRAAATSTAAPSTPPVTPSRSWVPESAHRTEASVHR